MISNKEVREFVEGRFGVLLGKVRDTEYAKQVAAGVFVVLLLGGAYSLGKVQSGEDDNASKSSFLGNAGEAFSNVLGEGKSEEEKLSAVVELDESEEGAEGSGVDSTGEGQDAEVSGEDGGDEATVVSLDGDSEEESAGETEDTSEPVNLCHFESDDSVEYGDVIISEVAWMGGESSANDEWIELYNRAGGIVSLDGWQVIDEKEQIHVVLGDVLIDGGGYLILERGSDEPVPGVSANMVYSGALSNSGEGLRLLNNNCELVDQVLAGPEWPAGDNNMKRTMQREGDLSWSTYGGELNKGVLGTPGGASGEIYKEPVPEEEAPELEESTEVPAEESATEPVAGADFSGLVISNVIYDVEGADGGKERIEIKNNSGADVDLSGGSLQYLPGGAEFATIRKKNFESGNVIPAGGTFLVGTACTSSAPCEGVGMSWSQSLGNEHGTVYLVENQEAITDGGDSDVGAEYSY